MPKFTKKDGTTVEIPEKKPAPEKPAPEHHQEEADDGDGFDVATIAIIGAAIAAAVLILRDSSGPPGAATGGDDVPTAPDDPGPYDPLAGAQAAA